MKKKFILGNCYSFGTFDPGDRDGSPQNQDEGVDKV